MTHSEKTEVSVNTVRLGRLWADYAAGKGIDLGKRVGETARYVWLDQTRHQWYRTLLNASYRIVTHRSGWTPGLASEPGAERMTAAAERAHRQLLLQSPFSWREMMLFTEIEQIDGPWPTLWLVTVNDETSVLYLAPHLGSYDAVLSALAADGPPAAYNPMRDSTSDGRYGQAWRVWCVDLTVPGWMVEYTAWAVPGIVAIWEAVRDEA
ncbi:MAG: hypothetical protein OXP08_08445 [bacterium]|nr:hypothetical protein [bacterium]